MDTRSEAQYYYPLFTREQVKELYHQATGARPIELSNGYNPQFVEVVEEIWQRWGKGQENVDRNVRPIDSDRQERQMLDSGKLVAGIVEYTSGTRSITVRIYGSDADSQHRNVDKFLGAADEVIHDSWIVSPLVPAPKKN